MSVIYFHCHGSNTLLCNLWFPLSVQLSCGDQLLISKKERIPIYVSLAQTFVDNKQFPEAVEYYKKELACRTDDSEQVQSCNSLHVLSDVVVS